MKTKTIDKLITIVDEIATQQYGISSINYGKCKEVIKELTEEKQRKERKKKVTEDDIIKHTVNNGNGTFTTTYSVKEKQQKNKSFAFFSTKPMEFIPILPDLSKDIEDLQKAIEEYNEIIKKQFTVIGETIKPLPFSITDTRRIIINDGEEFKELFHELAQAYLKHYNLGGISIGKK